MLSRPSYRGSHRRSSWRAFRRGRAFARLRQPRHEAAGDGGAGAAAPCGAGAAGGSGRVARRQRRRHGGRRRRCRHSDGGSGGSGGTTGGSGAERDATARLHPHRSVDGGTTDAGVDGGACPAMFNFETGIHGAMVNAGVQLAFQSIARSAPTRSAATARWRSRRCSAAPRRNSIKGEVLIDRCRRAARRPDQQDDHRSRRRGSRLQRRDLNFALVLNTQTAAVYFTPTFPIRPLTAAWKTGTVVLTNADAGTSLTALDAEPAGVFDRPAIRERSTSTRSTSGRASGLLGLDLPGPEHLFRLVDGRGVCRAALPVGVQLPRRRVARPKI